MENHQDFLNTAKKVLQSEAEAILSLIPTLDNNFNLACEYIYNCKGKIIMMGIGKSGHIAKKVAATMASTGTPAFFIHPAEASHGDLGMVSQTDLVVMFSNSGETDELITILPLLKRSNIKTISITSNASSKIAKYSDLHLLVKVKQEACPLNLAPTNSTTCALAMGDAIAISLLTARKFDKNDFAKNHPSGRIGKRLLLKVKDIMHKQDSLPLVSLDTPLIEGILEMSRKCFGLLLITDSSINMQNTAKIIGVLSDGDLRRILYKGLNLNKIQLAEVINRDFKYIHPEALAVEAINTIEKYKIFSLPVIANNKIVGIFNMHDLLKAGIL